MGQGILLLFLVICPSDVLLLKPSSSRFPSRFFASLEAFVGPSSAKWELDIEGPKKRKSHKMKTKWGQTQNGAGGILKTMM